MSIHVFVERYSGWKFIPIAIITTIATIPRTVERPMDIFLRYTQNPNTMAIKINNSDTMATEALDALAAISRTPASSYFAPKVEATIDAKAATTKSSVR